MLKVIDSFNIQNRGIIVILQHFENGIPPQSILYEKNNPGVKWKIKSRILNGTLLVEKQEIYFENKTQFTHSSPIFSKEKRKEALSKFIMERDNNIFEYILFSKKNNSKPKKDTILILKKHKCIELLNYT